MKILPSIYKILGVETHPSSRERNIQRGGESEDFRSDIAVLSEEGKLVAKAMGKLKEIPDIRSGKVDDLARRIEQGEYNVPLSQVAEELLKALLLDEI